MMGNLGDASADRQLLAGASQPGIEVRMFGFDVFHRLRKCPQLFRRRPLLPTGYLEDFVCNEEEGAVWFFSAAI